MSDDREDNIWVNGVVKISLARYKAKNMGTQ